MLFCRDIRCFEAIPVLSQSMHFCVEQKLTLKSCLWSKNDKYHVRSQTQPLSRLDIQKLSDQLFWVKILTLTSWMLKDPTNLLLHIVNSGWISQFCFFQQVLPTLDQASGSGGRMVANLDLSVLLLVPPLHSCCFVLSQSSKLSGDKQKVVQTNQAKMTHHAITTSLCPVKDN